MINLFTFSATCVKSRLARGWPLGWQSMAEQNIGYENQQADGSHHCNDLRAVVALRAMAQWDFPDFDVWLRQRKPLFETPLFKAAVLCPPPLLSPPTTQGGAQGEAETGHAGLVLPNKATTVVPPTEQLNAHRLIRSPLRARRARRSRHACRRAAPAPCRDPRGPRFRQDRAPAPDRGRSTRNSLNRARHQ
jgi:hypothetical protein